MVTTAPGAPTISEMPADNLSPTQTTTSQTHYRTPSPMRPPAQQQYYTPNVPSKSPNRKSENPYRVSRDAVENPVSPVDGPNSRHNFSYPSRNTLREPDDLTPKRSSGIDNLKAAAVGLHVS